MKAIVKSIMMIAMVAVMTVGATSAAWSNQSDVDDIQVGSGTADLQIKAGGAWVDDTDGATIGWNVSNMYPGQEIPKSFKMRNVSTANIALETEFQLTGLAADYPLQHDVWLKLVMDETGKQSSWKTLKEWRDLGVWDMKSDVINKGAVNNYTLMLKMDPNAGNDAQNKNASFSVTFTGNQVL